MFYVIAKVNPRFRILQKLIEKTPPGREAQVKKLKGKVDNPYAVAWASYNKSKKKKKKKKSK